MSEIVEDLRSEHPSDVGRWHRANRAADEIERLRKSLEQIGTVCADNASPRCNKGMALKFIADVVRVTLTNGE